jgi:hypothetical protein
LKRLAAIVLLIVLAAPLLYKSAMMLHYWSNLQYYAEVLCENKTRPEMHCNGSCAIAKELNAAEEGKANAEKNIPELTRLEVSTFLVTQEYALSEFEVNLNLELNTLYIEPKSEVHRLIIDRPPVG